MRQGRAVTCIHRGWLLGRAAAQMQARTSEHEELHVMCVHDLQLTAKQTMMHMSVECIGSKRMQLWGRRQ